MTYPKEYIVVVDTIALKKFYPTKKMGYPKVRKLLHKLASDYGLKIKDIRIHESGMVMYGSIKLVFDSPEQAVGFKLHHNDICKEGQA